MPGKAVCLNSIRSKMKETIIRQVREKDSKAICNIYNFYVENTIISFEEQEVTQKEMEERIHKTRKNYPWIVYEEEDQILGYAYVGRWKERAAYRHTVEDTLYVRHDVLGRGIGRALLESLLKEVRKIDVRVVMAVIALPNERSVKLHEYYGFKKTGHFCGVGYKMDRWIDVGYWELQL
jgi:phosphinothricin acetyltransferase